MKLQHCYLLIFTISVFLVACEKNDSPIEITTNDFHKTVDKLTEVMIHDVFSPPVASRIYTYPNIAAYEVVATGEKNFKSLSNQLSEFEEIPLTNNNNVNKKLAALIAYMDVAKELVFSKDKFLIYRDSLHHHWRLKNKDEFNKSRDFAYTISNHVLKWMNTDKYIETRTMPVYNILTDNPFKWTPTPPAFMAGIEPHWGKIRTMVLDSASQFKPLPPPVPSFDKKSDFYKELIEVYDIVNEITKEGDSSEKVAIAQFWDCNPYVSVNKGHFMFAEKKITPGAHWIGICKIACKDANVDFENTIYAYTKTSIAINDAFISCWDEKYRSNLVRPETLINKYIDEDWLPLLQTPPFPEYTSGHSVVSGAASEVLTTIFGDNFSFEDSTEVPYGLGTRKYNSFRDAAEEAAISRIYGGIHYMAAVVLGLEQGRKVGNKVNNDLTFKNK
jgi:hypothetical protein